MPVVKYLFINVRFLLGGLVIGRYWSPDFVLLKRGRSVLVLTAYLALQRSREMVSTASDQHQSEEASRHDADSVSVGCFSENRN